jgi:CheY-like chemotaxis protein
MEAAPSAHRTRVLLVDDNDSMRARAGAVLSPTCEVIGTAADGPAAIEAAGRLSPDVIVLDISMPGMTGFDVAARLRQEGSRAAIVFLTVYADDTLVVAAREAGGIGYVLKPFLSSDLTLAVEEARAGRQFVSTID